MPENANDGLRQTPDEIYFGTGGDVPTELESSRKKAREARVKANRKRTCRACETPVVIAN